VFVYAITMITAFVTHNLDLNHILQALLIFWLVWWGWGQFTWALNAVNTRIMEIRLLVLLSTGLAFIMASSIGDAFGTGVFWFAIPYVIMRTIGILLYTLVTSSSNKKSGWSIAWIVPLVGVGLVAVIIGAFSDPSIRVWWWPIAILSEIVVGGLFVGKVDVFKVNPGHFAERHGLIVIIALGESLIVAALALNTPERSQELILAGGLSVTITCLLWWSYFSWINEHLKEHLTNSPGNVQGILGKDVYTILHAPIIIGIIGIAVGFEMIMNHPHDIISLRVAISLAGGYSFFVGFSALSVWRMGKLVLAPRIIVLIISSIFVYFAIGHPPYLALSIIAGGLITINIMELNKCR